MTTVSRPLGPRPMVPRQDKGRPLAVAGFEAINRSSSLPALRSNDKQARQQPVRKATREMLPPTLRTMQFERVVDLFRMFNVSKNGQMDREEFYRMMKAVSVSDPVSRSLSDELFSAVDVDDGGTIEQEEFLSWCFSTHRVYCGGVSDRLRNLDPKQVMDYFNKVDANGNGQIDHGEFFTFMKRFAPEANMDRRATDKLFNSIDTDRSGEIDAKEFLNWVFPPATATSSGSRPSSSSAMRGKHHQRSARKGVTSSKPEEPAAKQEPVVLEFTIGPDFEHTVWNIDRVLKKEFEDRIKTKIILEKETKGCRKLVVPAGRGIVLWDRHTMIMHHDDPFVDQDSSRAWVLNMARKRLPTLMRAVNMK